MRRINLDSVQPNMVLARNIYDHNGTILLHKGITLNNKYIKQLTDRNIPFIFIEDERFAGIEIPEIVSEATRIKAQENIKKCFQEYLEKNTVNPKLICDTVNSLITEVLENRNVLVNLTDIRTHDNYTFAHSINVSILSILTGISLQLNRYQLKDLAIGAVMHDIGKIRVTKNLLNKLEPLDKNELEEIKNHPGYGFEILRKQNFPLAAAHVAFQHHEKYDGSGYPRGLKGEDIHYFARIVSVADAYDALTSNRPYGKVLHPYKAAIKISRDVLSHFEPAIVRAFLPNIAVFPIGTLVKLNTGHIGLIVDVHKKNTKRPIVRLLYDRNERPVKTPKEIDLLLTKNDIFIIDLVPETKLEELDARDHICDNSSPNATS